VTTLAHSVPPRPGPIASRTAISGASGSAVRGCPEVPQRNNSTSLRRALRVLDAVADYRGQPCGISLTSLAASLEMSKSTVLRLIAPLREHGLIHQDRDSGRYRLGPAAARLGAAFVERIDLAVLAADLLRDLSRRTGETAVLVISGSGMSERSAGASVLLALRPEKNAIGSATAIRTAESIDERGWWIQMDGVGPVCGTLAAPVHDHRSSVVAAIESTVTSIARGRPVGDAVRQCADALSERLGAPRPGSDLENRTTG
jgi:DNA-binding IclR family transcriptional regulator